eukprot:1974077-Karenia_brevis.AAC.1
MPLVIPSKAMHGASPLFESVLQGSVFKMSAFAASKVTNAKIHGRGTSKTCQAHPTYLAGNDFHKELNWSMIKAAAAGLVQARSCARAPSR